MYGQELNAESYAICKADMLIKGQDVANIVLGNTLSRRRPRRRRSSTTCSPTRPSASSGRRSRRRSRQEHEQKGFDGRFGPGLPRVSDGSLLFLMHLLSKMRPAKDGGSRFGIVLNGSPLFTGGAGSGESEIRRYVLENDLVEAIVALPTDMFYNTGIATYVWILSNRKPADRKGKVQLIDASRLLAEDAQEPGLQAQGDERRRHRHRHPAVRRLPEAELATRARRRRQGTGRATSCWHGEAPPEAPEGGRVKLAPIVAHLPERGVRLPHHHRRAPPAR